MPKNKFIPSFRSDIVNKDASDGVISEKKYFTDYI